jgi:phage gp36-like protein
MSYSTQQDLIDRFGQEELVELSDRSRSGAIDAVVVTRAIDDAAAEIDGYLSAKFALPLDPVPQTLKRIACDIARHHLYDDRVTEQVRNRYNDAIKFLKGVASGEISIGVDASAEAPAATGGPQHEAEDRVYTRDSLSDF